MKYFVAERYMRFIAMLSQYSKSEFQSSSLPLLKALTFRSCLREPKKAVFAIAEFSRVLSVSPEVLAVKRLACFNVMAERGLREKQNIPGYSFETWKRVKAEMMSDFCLEIRHLGGSEEVEESLKLLGLSENTAFELLMQAVTEGEYPNAITNLGHMFHYGATGVEIDRLRAAELYQKAIDRGDIEGMICMANLIVEGGEGVQQNTSYAMELYQRAIDEGRTAHAKVRLADVLISLADENDINVPRAIELYQSAIDEGRGSEAMWRLADLLDIKSKENESNVSRAMELYQRAVDEHKDAYSMHRLAERGEHGDRDVPRAVDLYTRAIEEKKCTDSMMNLAELLVRGADGVAVDVRRAAQLIIMRAKEVKNAFHMTYFANALRKGLRGCSKDPRQAAAYMKQQSWTGQT